MFPWLTISQLFDRTVSEQRTQDPRYSVPELLKRPAEPVYTGPLARPVEESFSLADYMRQGDGPVRPVDAGPSTAAVTTALAGLFGAGIGTFFSVRSDQNSLKAQSLSLEHEETMSASAARNAERTAQSIIESSQHEVGRVTAQAGADKATRSAVMAARGVALDSASATEVQATGEFIKQADVMGIGVNAAEAAAAARTRGVNARNNSAFARLSARNVRASAGNDFAPFAALSATLVGGASRMGMQYATDRRYPRLT